MPASRQFAHSRLILLAVLLTLGIGALFARSVWTIRNDEWRYATRNGENLALTLEQGVRWSLDSFDQSLQGAVREVGRTDVWSLPPSLRARLVFDNSLSVNGAGDVVVLDAAGRILLDSTPAIPRDVDLSDRDYFKVFKDGKHQGLFIGKPVFSRFSNQNVLPLSRGIYREDGSFAGVVAGVIRLSYLNKLFEAVNLGPQSGVNLFSQTGIVITRFPYNDTDTGKDLSGTPNIVRIQKERSGSFVGTASIDKLERLYSFKPVGDYPLFITVAQSTQFILSQWYRNAWMLGGFALALMVASLGLTLLFVRELRLRQKVSAQLRSAEQDVRAVLDNTPSMIGYWDANLHNRLANWAYHDWFGASPDKMVGMHISDLLGPELYALNKPMLDRALQGEPQRFERVITDPKGRTHQTVTSYLPDVQDGAVCGIYVQVIDITDRKRMEEELFEEKERMRLTLRCIGEAVVCSDAQGKVTYLNPAAEQLTGWQAFDAAGHSVDEVVSLHSPANDDVLSSPLRLALQQGQVADVLRGVVVHRSSGQRFQVEETASPILDSHGNVTGAVAVLRDVTEAAAMAQRMAHLAQYDALTDLPNRVLLQDRAQLAISQARRTGKSLAVMYLDLDGFKAVNDRLGHDVGDQLLVQFAQRLKSAVRASDTVCRQGGDEFVVLLPGLDNAEAVCHVARKMLSSCDAPFDLAGELLQLGLSGGIALYPQHGDTFDALSRHADSAMYAAKRGGRMRFMLYQGPEADPKEVLHSTALDGVPWSG